MIGVLWGAAAALNATAVRDRLHERYPRAVVARPVQRGVDGSTANP